MNSDYIAKLIHDGEIELAAAIAETELAKTRNIDERTEIATQLVRTRRMLGEYTVSLEVSTQIQGEAINHSVNLGPLLVETANTQRLMRNYDESEDTLKTAIKVMDEDERYKVPRIQAIWSLGVLQRVRENYDDAFINLLEAKKACEDIGYALGIAHCCREIGVTHRQTGQLDQANTEISKAMELYKSAGDAMGVAHTHRELGTILRIQDRHIEALDELMYALHEFSGINAVLGTANTYTELGALYQALGETTISSEYYETAKQLYKKLGDSSGILMLEKIQSET